VANPLIEHFQFITENFLFDPDPARQHDYETIHGASENDDPFVYRTVGYIQFLKEMFLRHNWNMDSFNRVQALIYEPAVPVPREFQDVQAPEVVPRTREEVLAEYEEKGGDRGEYNRFRKELKEESESEDPWLQHQFWKFNQIKPKRQANIKDYFPRMPENPLVADEAYQAFRTREDRRFKRQRKDKLIQQDAERELMHYRIEKRQRQVNERAARISQRLGRPLVQVQPRIYDNIPSRDVELPGYSGFQVVNADGSPNYELEHRARLARQPWYRRNWREQGIDMVFDDHAEALSRPFGSRQTLLAPLPQRSEAEVFGDLMDAGLQAYSTGKEYYGLLKGVMSRFDMHPGPVNWPRRVYRKFDNDYHYDDISGLF
jgi:hypothetical protein